MSRLSTAERDTLVESMLIKANDSDRGPSSDFAGFEAVFTLLTG